MADLRPPIILVDGPDVQFFSSPEAVEGYVEAIDVRDGVYRVFDSFGQKLKLEARGDSVFISPAEATSQHEGELEQLLRDALRHTTDDPSLDLTRLLEISARVFGMTR